MRPRKTVIYTILLIIGIVLLTNYISSRFFFRLDLTEDNRYTLSDATKDILRSLDETVTVSAYFTQKLPPQYANLRREFKELLIEFQNISKGKLVYEFLDPLEDEKLEQEALQKGIFQAQIQGQEKDEFKVSKAYMGAELALGEDTEVIPIIQSTEGMEYLLTTAIKKLSVLEKPTIGIVRGHGEPGLQELQTVNYALDVLYNVEEAYLTDNSNLERYNTLAIVAPTDSFSISQLQKLDEHLAKGKGLVIAMNKVDADLNQQSGKLINTGLETWLGDKGIQVNNNFVIDKNCGFISVQRQQGPFMVQQPLQMPYFPIITNFTDHPITKGLEQVAMQFASSINFYGDSSIKYTPIAQSSEAAGTEPAPGYMNIIREWQDKDFPLSDIIVGATFEGKLSGNLNSRLVLFTDGDFPVGGARQQQNPQQIPDNISLLVNAIDWLSDDTGLINLRTKGSKIRQIDADISDGKRLFLKTFNFALPILLIIIVGVVRYQARLRKRIKRMEVNYV